MTLAEKLVYVGKIVALEPIENADFIVSATVICGHGGKWRGVVRKNIFNVGDCCTVYLPDSIIPPSIDMDFMKATNWRVRMRRFKGAPSEVVIMPGGKLIDLGQDITLDMGVVKYFKPIPASLNGEMLGDFPSFIPKTDEPNYQRVPELVEKIQGRAYYITTKMDGSSTTAYKFQGHFGVCSRNLEIIESESNGYWKMANKYNLRELLPEGIALQWETCGPGIQSNPMGLEELSAFVFSAYNIVEHEYLRYREMTKLLSEIGMPLAEVVDKGLIFDCNDVSLLGEGLYPNGSQREGVVIRTQYNLGGAPISFKVINLNYDR